MKKQTKVSIEVRDLEPLKNITAGRRRRHRSHGQAFAQRAGKVGEYRGGLGPFGLNKIP